MAVLALAVASCADDDASRGGSGDPPEIKACTRVGCVSQLTVILQDPPPERARVRVCVEGRCRTVRAARGRVAVPVAPGSGAAASVTVEVVGHPRSRATADVRLRELRPNGPDCPPTCLRGTAFYDARDGRLMSR